MEKGSSLTLNIRMKERSAMKFKCSRDALHEMLARLTSIVPLRAPKPVLQNILIQGNTDQTLTCSATDLEIGICYTLPVEALEEPSTFLVSAHCLYGIVRDDWSTTISFEVDEERMLIHTAKGKFELLCSVGEAFPKIKEIGTENVIDMEGATIVDGVEKTLFSTAKGDSRYALNGVHINIEEELCEFVTSDTHRLSLCKKVINNPNKTKCHAIVITKGMSELAKLADGEANVKIQITPHELIAKNSCSTMVARLVDGQFPRYREVIPTNTVITVEIDREEMLRGLRLVGRVSNQESHAIRFKAEGNKVILKAAGGETGSGEVTLEATTTGEPVEANFNYNYVMDALRVLKEAKVVFNFRTGDDPVRLDEGDFVHVIMPIRAFH